MGEWIDIERWPECRQMERPGVVFEVESAEGQVLTTRCVVPLELPFDWTAAPVRFREVREQKPRHSAPLPPPAD